MKKFKYSATVRNLLCFCMAFSWIISAKYPSFLLFGEQPYPKKPE